MNFTKRGTAEDARAEETEIEGSLRELMRKDASALRQSGSNGGSDAELGANSLSGLLRRVSGHSMREIDNLIYELQSLRERLEADGARIQRDIVDYAALSQSVVQMTRVIADGVTQVKKVPDAPSITQ